MKSTSPDPFEFVREVMAQAAANCGVELYAISFKGALQTLNRFQSLLEAGVQRTLPELYTALLAAIASHRVGNRPDRYEPRAVKRRPKPHALLNIPRKEARKRLERAG